MDRGHDLRELHDSFANVMQKEEKIKYIIKGWRVPFHRIRREHINSLKCSHNGNKLFIVGKHSDINYINGILIRDQDSFCFNISITFFSLLTTSRNYSRNEFHFTIYK